MYGKLGLVALFGLAGVLVGCGGDDGSSDTTAASTTTSADTTPAASTDQLDAVLLTASDVGADWQLGPPINEADLADATQIPCTDSAIDPAIADRLTPITGVQFEPVDSSSKHLVEFLVAGDADQLDRDLQALFNAMDACAATTPTTTETGSLTVERLLVPDLGEQRAAYASTGVQSPQVTWFVRNAQVRVGPLAVEIGLTEILATPDDAPSISDAEFVRLVETAVAKLGGSTTELANPASQYCVEQGGRVDIVDEAGGQVGYCELPDGRRIEEWEHYRARNADQP